jgi:predicted Zn-dependent protease
VCLLPRHDHSVNAWSLPDGEVIVDRGLATLLGSNRGLWAALLSHEIAHVGGAGGIFNQILTRV